MENASKALIIAGAILLAIAIIGVGMYVFNNIRGSRVKTLIDTVNNHNLTAIDNTEKIQILFNANMGSSVDVSLVQEGQTETEHFTEIKNLILEADTYTISFGYDSNSGFITSIYILDREHAGYYD